jgi:hypothetical protein
MIAFDHGALQRHREPPLAGILAHGMLELLEAQAVTFLAHAERLTVIEWLEILERARELRARRLPAVRRLHDTIALDEPTVIGMMANERIAAIARPLEQELREEGREAAGVLRFVTAAVTQLTVASHAIEWYEELGAADLERLYAPFESFIPIEQLG